MNFKNDNGALIGHQRNETLRIDPWGVNSLRVRATMNPELTGQNRALNEMADRSSDIQIGKNGANIRNGRISAEINDGGVLTFYRDGRLILREYYRNYGGTLSRESRCLKEIGREFKGLAGNDWKLTVRFEGNDGEKIFGMGQYQNPYLDLNGCSLELCQKNSQVTIPFAMSSLGYGFLWNNPAIGNASFAKNYTEWTALDTEEMDYWITADEDPAAIEHNYTDVVGRAPLISEDMLTFWQCKLRYRTQEEVLDVAHHYREIGMTPEVIVIDFFHWPHQGDWCFDEKYWPDPKAMCDELHEMGIKVMVSVWPSVDRRSSNFDEMFANGLLVRTERGAFQTYDYQGDCLTLDTFNPEAREFVWQQCRRNYIRYGIDMFWLDNSEPDYAVYDFDNYRYFEGPAQKVGNMYPLRYLQAFSKGQEEEGHADYFSLIRSAWVGSQKYGALVWSGDVPSTFEAFRDQFTAGLNIGIAGIPWWTTDIGGFMTDDVNDPDFVQLLIRWFEFAVYCPVLRMHGDRGPYDIPALDNRDFGGGYLHTGQPNEIWSYGEEAYDIMLRQLGTRKTLKPYLISLMKETHETGAPLMRTMFYEFPQDKKCWECEDQYMFGPDYLVAPILELNCFKRDVYLPEGRWKDLNTGRICSGGATVTCDAPIGYIPVFQKM